MFAKIENGVVTQWHLGQRAIQEAHPNTSFSFPLSDAALEHFGYARLVYSNPPEYNPETQEPKELPPLVNGVEAVQQWEIVAKTV